MMSANAITTSLLLIPRHPSNWNVPPKTETATWNLISPASAVLHDAKPVNVSSLAASIYEAQCSFSPMLFVRRWGFTEKGARIWAKRKFSPLVTSFVGWVVVQSSKNEGT